MIRLLWIGLIAFVMPLCAFETVVPRKIIALYDSQYQDKIYYLNLHRFAEMPLNHLGLNLRYHDIQQGLPDLSDLEDVRGVLTWFPVDSNALQAESFLQWAIATIDAGKKFVLMGGLGFLPDKQFASPYLQSTFWAKLGLKNLNNAFFETYLTDVVVLNPFIGGFERSYAGIPTDYPLVQRLSKDVAVHVEAVHRKDRDLNSILVATSSNGGYTAPYYAAYKDEADYLVQKWLINPFEFFRLAFQTDDLPKPDTTTFCGRRICYSQIDGDGWNNLTQIEELRDEGLLSSEVITREIFQKYPYFPFSSAPIGAEVDLKWVGLPKSLTAAKEMFALPNVEMSCHTYTHPFDWGFFANYRPDYEALYFGKFQNGDWGKRNLADKLLNVNKPKELATEGKIETISEGVKYPPYLLSPGYVTPRAYALEKFNIDLEVLGAIQKINSLSVDHKQVTLYQWSGNCHPFEQAVRLTREGGVRNINGGDSRFDNHANSYSWVAPVGIQVGNQQQIYSSNANEILYTNSWSEKFYAFNQLRQTFKNTETPIRVKPMDVYFHMFSGEKSAGLEAIKQNLDYIEQQTSAIPLFTSQFAAIADGFFTATLLKLEDQKWKITERGDLQTLRFDKATFQSVDFSNSSGVIGQRHFQGSLYVFLDPAVSDPTIKLKINKYSDREPQENAYYLIESTWQVSQVQQNREVLQFIAQGLGSAKMVWQVPSPGLYSIKIQDKGGTKELTATTNNTFLSFSVLDYTTLNEANITVKKTNES